MGMLVARRWKKLVAKASESIKRAAFLQARQIGISSPSEEARKIASSYRINEKKGDWREYGDIAFHIIAVYPPDLGLYILYAIREVSQGISYDPVPFIFGAIERIYYLKPQNLELHLQIDPNVERLIDNPAERARTGAKLLSREISGTSLRYASGILKHMDSSIKPLLEEELSSFNPESARILFRCSRAWILTRAGFLHWLMRVLLGKEE